MIAQSIETFGFLVTLIIIGLISYWVFKVTFHFLGWLTFVILFLILLFIWVPGPLEPFLGPVVGFLMFLWNTGLTTMLDGLNFVRNLGG